MCRVWVRATFVLDSNNLLWYYIDLYAVNDTEEIWGEVIKE